MTDEEKKKQEQEEGTPICENCGNAMLFEEGEWMCPHCQGEIDFLGGEEEDDE